MRHIITGAAISAALIFGVTACGSGDDDSESYSTARDVAVALGCDAFTVSEPDEMAESTGSCTFDGTDFEISTFANEKVRDNYIAAGESMADSMGMKPSALVGANWTVWTYEGDVSAFEDTLGGETR